MRDAGADAPSLLDVAAAVADLTPVDWPALEAEATDPVSRAALKRLRLLDRIVRACAAIVPPGEAVATPAEDAPPATWGPLTIHERLGRGSFGDVYRAHDRRLDRIVALKLLKPGRADDESSGAEVIREGQRLAKVRHPNVVTVYGAERIDGRVGMWMEFVDGRTLEEELRASGPLSADNVIDVGLALCSALTAVHEAGLLHRDLKAQNVMRSADGRVLLTDFGAGRVREGFSGSDDGRTELAGTPLYLAPEVLNGASASVATEIYGVGVLLYHLATGSFPVRGRTLRELRDGHARGERVGMQAYRDKVPKRLASIIERAIDPDPLKRFTSPEDLRQALLRCRRSTTRVAAWIGVLELGAVLAVAGLNLVWSMEPPLEVLSQTVIDLGQPLGRIALMGAKGERRYFGPDDKMYSIVPEQPGSSVTISDAAGPFRYVDVNPGREEYLAIRGADARELWLVSRQGGNRRIGDIRCNTAAWSPDGRQVLCVFDSVLSIVRPDGTQPRILPTPSAAGIVFARWSPTRGDTVRFVASVGTRGEVETSLWEVRADGTGLRPLLPGWNVPPAELFGAWTPDGQYFVFASMVDHHADLWAIRESHGILDWTRPQPVRLTHGAESYEFAPIVSYDNRTVMAIGVKRQGELVRYDRNERRFVRYLNGLSATSVSASPDGTSIAYITYPGKKLWRAAADATGARQLVNEPVDMDGASWSPDNKWIAFQAKLEGRQLKIFLVPTDGSDPPKAISAEDRGQGFPSWSPDGAQFCFGDVPEHYGTSSGTEVLHIYDVTSRSITDVPGSTGFWTCRWSPDGRYLAAVTISRRPEDAMRLNIYDRQTRVWRPLPKALHVNTPTWSRDSTSIYYETEGAPTVFRRVRLADGNVEDCMNLEGARIILTWTGLAPDDSPVMLRDVGTKTLYAIKLGRQ